jgi:thiamine kinase-like enzyme
MMMPEQQSDPIVVVKVHRLQEISESVDREVLNLRRIEALLPNKQYSFPRIIAHEHFQNHSLLVETALPGALLSPARLRKNVAGHTHQVIDWLLEIQQTATKPSSKVWYPVIAQNKIDYFRECFPLTDEEDMALQEVEKYINVLSKTDLPFVIEHGDLSHPNIILLKQGGVGLVDWELSEVEGMLAYDLFLFLSYVTFSSADANTSQDYRTPFLEMFFGEEALAQDYIHAYADAMQIPSDLLPPLFLLTWTRYLINLLIRLRLDSDTTQMTSQQTVNQLRNNRYYDLWRLTIEHYSELNLYR